MILYSIQTIHVIQIRGIAQRKENMAAEKTTKNDFQVQQDMEDLVLNLRKEIDKLPRGEIILSIKVEDHKPVKVDYIRTENII